MKKLMCVLISIILFILFAGCIEEDTNYGTHTVGKIVDIQISAGGWSKADKTLLEFDSGKILTFCEIVPVDKNRTVDIWHSESYNKWGCYSFYGIKYLEIE